MRRTSELSILWVGADGSEWELADPSLPVRLTGEGVAGLHMPDSSSRWSTSANIPGRRRHGVVYEGRELTLPVRVGDGTVRGPEWRDLDARWWNSFSADTPGTLIVSTVRGRRRMQLWLEDAPLSLRIDPVLTGYQHYEITLSAEDAFWSGDEMDWPFEFEEESGEDFFGGAAGGGFGPDFVISGASELTGATVFNPGDREAWPRYVLKVPFGSARIGIGDAVIELPFGSGVAQEIRIDTDPRRLTIENELGENLWPLLGSAPDPLFAPVPPKQEVSLTLQLEAAQAGASVVVYLTPPYRRALS